jgi:hypothetical protein
VAAAKRPTDRRLVQTIEKSALEDWRAAAWLIGFRREERPVVSGDSLDELAKKRSARRKAS